MVERNEQELVRIEKLQTLRSKGFSFPNDIKALASSRQVLEAQVDEPASAKRFSVAGRIVQMRLMGKASFVHILDGAGKIQLYVKQDAVGPESFEKFKEYDIGDIIEATGYAFVTKTGEKSLHVESQRLLTKSLIPLPEKWHGLSDIELRYRRRYVDLIANPDVRDIFRSRAKIISSIRRFLDSRGYVEVETPVLQYIPGGADAKPFKTHHNSLGEDMYLRVATELPLKKLIVGGLERVYEIGRIFRNEGVSKKHNPEFTSLEFYEAFANFQTLMTLTEDLILGLVKDITGGLKVRYGEQDIDFTPPWPRISMRDSIWEIAGVPKSFDLDTLEGVQKAAQSFKVELDEPEDWGRSLEALWGDLVEPKLINPTFIIHHPYSISPLARKCDHDSKITDRFELIISGMEIANAFSELNDPIDQRERFEAQAKRKAGGDEEAHDIEEDFLRAIEYGLPPTGGEGIGIDRLVMLLTNSPTIREVLLFPQLKPGE